MVENLVSLIIFALVVVGIGWLIIRLLSRSYVKTTATTAFVRTGGLRGARAARPTVVSNGAAWVFGFLHRIKWVSLETMAVEVRHLEENALVTTDPQYVDLEARFFVRIANSPEAISMAARTIGGDMVSEANVRRLVEPKINGAVRDVAASFEMRRLLEKRIEFIQQVQARLRDDLAENGLVLESVSILILKPTLQGVFSTDDILGAQVARANAAVIEEALTEKTRLERHGSLERARLDADAERQQLSIHEEIETERAERTKNITMVRAAEEATARVAQEQRREEAERAKLLADRSLEEEKLENERLIVLLREQMQKAVELEKILRDEALALAEQERQTHVIEAEIIRLNAARAQIEADRERERTLQEAMTVTETIAAEREAAIDMIDTRLEADKRILEARSQVEIDVMREQERADVELKIARAQAETIRTRAEADLDATKMSALGERERASAAGLAEVQVDLERIKVLLQEAEATRQKLLAEAEGEKAKAEALASHNAVAKDLELARLNADALKAIEIARAQALGQAIEGMNMNVIGDSATAHRLLQLIATAQSIQPVYDALPTAARETLDHWAGRLAGRQASSGQADLSALYTLILSLEQEQPGLFDDDLTFGQAAAILLERKGSAEGAISDNLRQFSADPDLKDLPFKSVLALVTRAVGAGS